MFNTIPNNPFPPSSANAGGGSYALPVASADTLGGVKVGSNLSIDDGVLSAPAPYSLPTASADTLGGVKVGNGLSIDYGVLSNNNPTPYTPADYSTTEVDTGAKWIDDNKIYRKVITFQSDLTVSNSSWTSTSEAISDIDTLISAQGVYDDACYPLMGSFDSSGVLSMLACRASSSVDVKKIIVEYTKTPASV